MKHKNSILICGGVLAAILGLSVTLNTAYADETTDNSTISTENVQNNTLVDNDTIETRSFNQVTYPGGDWNVDPTDAIPNSNYYYYVNAQWQEDNQASDDKPVTGINQDTQMDVSDQLDADIQEIQSGQITDVSDGMKHAVEFYTYLQNTYGVDDPNAYKAMMSQLNQINDLKDIDDFNNNLSELYKSGLNLPFSLRSDVGVEDSSQYILHFAAGYPVFPQQIRNWGNKSNIGMSIYAQMSNKLLGLIGYDSITANNIVAKAMKYDELLAKNTNQDIFQNDLAAQPVPDYTVNSDDFINNFDSLDINKLITETYGSTGSRVSIDDLEGYRHINDLINPNTFDEMKSWMVVNNLVQNAELLGSKAQQIYHNNNLYSEFDAQDPEDFANENLYNYYGSILSNYYGSKYTSDQTIAGATKMVTDINQAFAHRLESNTWLSQSTKNNAIAKLNKMAIKIGYPTQVTDSYSDVNFDQYIPLITIIDNLNQIDIENSIESFSKPVDRSIWTMGGYEVNAQYDPSRNEITIPSAQISKAFYDVDGNSSENYGSLGATIGHEISHAFDNIGALYDADGNLNNWWTDNDFANFQDIVQKMSIEYNNIPYNSTVLDGYKSVGENMADNSGLVIALDVAKKQPDFNINKFFESWAKSWQYSALPIIDQMYAIMDEHIPGPVRVNVTLQNMDDFYKTYDIKKGDAMWLDPEKRITIW
ncbi:M13 family metallopeptidase [Lactobacillus terrae]|uniref:M13 family metallopeptidase n=1 Tax=Lactobacillus terrae TaxID=2269374 RepID=UPI0014733EAD|nr:M13 family metallopeptidase [Lactobacillus terrae]